MAANIATSIPGHVFGWCRYEFKS